MQARDRDRHNTLNVPKSTTENVLKIGYTKSSKKDNLVTSGSPKKSSKLGKLCFPHLTPTLQHSKIKRRNLLDINEKIIVQESI